MPKSSGKARMFDDSWRSWKISPPDNSMGSGPETFALSPDHDPGTVPPHPGLVFDKTIHHWVRPETGEATHDHEGKPVESGAAKAPTQPSAPPKPAVDLNKPQAGEKGSPAGGEGEFDWSTPPEYADAGLKPEFDWSTPEYLKEPATTETKPATAKPKAEPSTSQQKSNLKLPAGYVQPKNALGQVGKPNEKLDDSSRPELSLEEAKSLETYSGKDYHAINSSLRKGEPRTADLEKVHAGLQKAFAKAKPFAKPVEVTRGIKISSPDVLSQMKAAAEQSQKTGKPLTLPGYQSATTNPDVAKTAGGRKSNVTYQINATHGLDVRPYSSAHTEDELLLNHNSQFSVKRVEQSPDGHLTIHLDQLPPKGQA